MTTLPASARLADYRGRSLRRVSGSNDSLLLVDDGDDFPDALERGTSYGATWVRVPRSAVTRTWTRVVEATVDGEPAEVTSVRGDQVEVFTRSSALAKSRGLRGGPDEAGGWYGAVPTSAVTDVAVTEVDETR